jgi:hypothetical protein
MDHIEDKTRELSTRHRQEAEALQEKMLDRAESALDSATGSLSEAERELITQKRQQSEHLQETMLERAAAEIQADAQATE